LLTALTEEFGGPTAVAGNQNGKSSEGISWTRPEGGLYVWMSFPPQVSTGPGSALMEAALKNGVLYVPGQFCYVKDSNGPVPTHEARLSYGVAPVEQIPEAVRRLSQAASEANAGNLMAAGSS